MSAWKEDRGKSGCGLVCVGSVRPAGSDVSPQCEGGQKWPPSMLPATHLPKPPDTQLTPPSGCNAEKSSESDCVFPLRHVNPQPIGRRIIGTYRYAGKNGALLGFRNVVSESAELAQKIRKRQTLHDWSSVGTDLDVSSVVEEPSASFVSDPANSIFRSPLFSTNTFSLSILYSWWRSS